mgnify:CR=1 FL=1
MKKLFLLVLAHVIVTAVVCALLAVVAFSKPELIAGTQAKYSFFLSLSFFLKALPAAVASGFLVGASVSLEEIAGGAVARFKTVVLSSLFCIFVVFFSTEVFSPLVSSTLSELKDAPRVFRTFFELGQRSFQDGHMDMALKYATEALSVNPNDEDARKLRENAISLGNATVDLPRLKTQFEKENSIFDNEKSEELFDLNFSYNEIAGRSAEELLQKSEVAEDEARAGNNGKWLDAHYYALLAFATSPRNSEISLRAKRQAFHFWSVLKEPSELSDTPEMQLYRQKKEAYTLMASGNNIGAYFTFQEILETNELARDDPDIKKFLKIVTERVESAYFFTDELSNLRRFESFKNVRFSIPRSDGAFDVVAIRGITPIRENGKLVQYLREFSVFSYKKNGEFIRSVFAPYAHLSFEDVSDFTSFERDFFEIPHEAAFVPYILLHGLDSSVQGKETVPEYSFGEIDDEKIKREKSDFLVLPLDESDYNILCAASAGEEHLSPAKLWSLFNRAHLFGYAEETFGARLLHCFFYPLLLLVFFIFLAKIAWNNRIQRGELFRFSWIFILPFLMAMCQIAYLLISYFVRMLAFAFVSSMRMTSFVAIFVIGVVTLLYVSTSFIIHARTQED